MSIRHALSVAASLIAALILTGCFVVAKNAPTGSGPINDPRLVGTWQGLDNEGKEDPETFMHFLRKDEKKPLQLVWVDDDSYRVIEFTTMRIGNKNVFAAKIEGPAEMLKDKDVPAGYYLGFYEVNGNEMSFNLLETDKVSALIDKGLVKGVKPSEKYGVLTLTGSSADIAKFMGSPEAASAVLDEPARLRRIAGPKK